MAARPELLLLASTIAAHLDAPDRLADTRATADALVPAPERGALDQVLASRQLSYRDALLIQLAYSVRAPGLDTTKRQIGARGVAGRLALILREAHIPHVMDAFQNIGKNTLELARGNYPAFDSLLRWAASATPEQLSACLEYACAVVAAQARPVRPMPQLSVSRLTFAAVMGLYQDLLATPSQGAHEQYIVASLLDALIQQTGSAHGYRVETKGLNISDRSSRAAGDIQVMVGNRVIEAYEITGNVWTTKLDAVSDKLRAHDLTRIHIIAPLAAGSYAGVARDLLGLADDVSVIDLHGFIATVLSALTRAFREVALRRLYELLDRLQEDVDLVNAYVEALHRGGLAQAAS